MMYLLYLSYFLISLIQVFLFLGLASSWAILPLILWLVFVFFLNPCLSYLAVKNYPSNRWAWGPLLSSGWFLTAAWSFFWPHYMGDTAFFIFSGLVLGIACQVWVYFKAKSRKVKK